MHQTFPTNFWKYARPPLWLCLMLLFFGCVEGEDVFDTKLEPVTKAPAVQLRLDDKPLAIKDGTVKANLAFGEDYVLAWWLEGRPSTTYRVELKADNAKVRGRLPAKGKIARGRTKTGDTRMFTLERSGKKKVRGR